MAGRHKRHPQPIGVAERAAALSALRHLTNKKRVKQVDIVNNIFALQDEKSLKYVDRSLFINCSFAIDESILSRAKNGVTELDDGHSWALYLWLKEKHNDLIEEKLVEETLNHKEKLVTSFNELVGGTVDLKGLETLKGAYQLFRPSFQVPDKELMLSIFTVGSANSDFDCTMVTSFPDDFDELVTETVHGKIVPHERTLTCFMSAPKSRSTFVISFHKIQRANDESGHVSYMNGVMLAASGPHPSSAWPVYARHFKPGAEPTTTILSGDQLADLPRAVRESLSRGIVHWDKQYFPGPAFDPS